MKQAEIQMLCAGIELDSAFCDQGYRLLDKDNPGLDLYGLGLATLGCPTDLTPSRLP